MPELRETGAELVAISPQLPEWSARIARRHSLDFDILSDHGNDVARQWGLEMTIEGALRELYETGFQLDMSKFNGDDSWALPVPARFVIGQDGRVIAVDADPDYTRRPEPDATLEILRAL